MKQTDYFALLRFLFFTASKTDNLPRKSTLFVVAHKHLQATVLSVLSALKFHNGIYISTINIVLSIVSETSALQYCSNYCLLPSDHVIDNDGLGLRSLTFTSMDPNTK